MTNLDSFATLFAGFIFGFLYTQEKELVLKWFFLFIAITLISISFINNYYINKTVSSTSTITGNTTTTYSYGLDNSNVPIGTGIGITLIVVLLFFVWKIFKSLKL